ncbi:MAG: outer membrane beta-barrel protein, partial [Alistipes sp.]|nr:outer membrane beta-barrel protein [Alistipes sp.]
KETGMQWGRASGGLSYKFYTATKIVGGIQADLQYMGRGFMYDTRNDGDTSYHRTLNTIELPFMWQPHFYMAQQHVRVFINLGVYLNYVLSSEEYYQSKQAGEFDRKPYEMILTRDPRWGYGLCGGGGIGVLFGRFEANFEARYYFGYSDVLRNGTKYKGNPTHSPLDNLNMSFGFYYRLSKEGIRAAPTQGVLRRMQEAEARKLARKLAKQTPTQDSLASSLTPITDSIAAGLSALTPPAAVTDSTTLSEAKRITPANDPQEPQRDPAKAKRTKKDKTH